MGSGYVIEHCVSAFSDMCEEKAFRSYIADGIKCISEAIANTYGGSYLQERYADLVSISRTEEKTGDEIALEVIEKAGLKVG